MQNSETILLKAIGRVISRERKRRKLKFTIFCYENDIPKTTLYMLEKSLSKSYITNVFRVISAMGLSFEEFGALVDKELPEGFSFSQFDE